MTGQGEKKKRSDLVPLKGDVNVPRRGKEDRIKGKKVWEERELKEKNFKDKRTAEEFAWPEAGARRNFSPPALLRQSFFSMTLEIQTEMTNAEHVAQTHQLHSSTTSTHRNISHKAKKKEGHRDLNVRWSLCSLSVDVRCV